MAGRAAQAEPGAPGPGVAVILPVLNEAGLIERRLRELLALQPAEIIVVDGGSADDTRARARAIGRDRRAVPVLRWIEAARGRARQMNAGARLARAGILLFLHADTRLPAGALRAVERAIAGGARWGRFDVRLEGDETVLRLIGWLMNRRSALTGIVTGDQALFVRREVFFEHGGFAPIPLMEDIELSRRLKRVGRPRRLRRRVVTSARRWRARGILRTVLLMWALRFLYWLGVSPARLARWYR